MSISNTRNSSFTLLAIFIILTCILCTGGYILYQHQKKDITREKQNELVAINRLKIEQAVNWRNNLLFNAKSIFYDQSFIKHIHDYNLGYRRKSNNVIISGWILSQLKEFDYSNALLVNPAGKIVVNTNTYNPLTESGKQIINQAIQKKEIVISDFGWYNNSMVCIYVAVPLYLDPELREECAGVALLNIDPRKYLFPLLKNWPTTSTSGETALIRREGDRILYLNDLRNYNNSPLNLRESLNDTLLLTTRVIMGHKGIMEGVDYRGLNVLADAEPVPNTNWFIITKIDTGEVYQTIRKQAALVLSFTVLLIFFCALIIYMIWKNHSVKTENKHQAMLKHFDYLVKYANDIIILTDLNGNIYEANDKAINSYGYPREELLKINLSLLNVNETKDGLKEILDSIDNNDGILYETINVRRNGEKFPIESSGRRMEVNGINYYQFIVRDITERKKIEADLINAKEKAEESDRLKTAFLNNMSHEIRTPMNGILGFSELLDDDELSSDDRTQFIKIIHNNSQHLLSVINDIIDISKIQSNQLTLSNVSFNLHHLLDELLITYENEKILNDKNDVKFIVEKAFDDNHCTIVSDDIRIRQILYNLLSNALKFTKTGFIKFGYIPEDGKLQFYVQDTGKGVSKEKQFLIFERFRQEEDTYTREFGGTGLGLSISKGLVELLGGNMWMESEEGIGTTFYFTIPHILDSIDNVR
jgi:PAS domain S-box-containing protein